MISTNYVTRAVCELLADKISGGYSLHVGNQEIPLYLNKDKVTKYPQIRLSPFIEKGDARYQKYIEQKYQAYRHWQYGVFQVDIYSQNLATAQNIYDSLSSRLFDFFNLETVIFDYNNLFDQIDDNVFRSREYSLMDDGLFKDVYGIRIEDTILKRVKSKKDLYPESFFVSEDFLYVNTKQDIKKIKIKMLTQGRLFSNGFSHSDNGIHAYYLSKQRNLSSLEDNEVERVSFDLEILFSKKINREKLPEVNRIMFNKANVR